MALGGGVWVTQNKTLPGSYINIVSASKATATVGERGVVAIPMALNKAVGEVITITRAEFIKDSKTLLGIEFTSDEAKPLREIFCNAAKVYIYDMGEEGTASEAVAALEPYDFNIFCAYTGEALDQ